MIFFFLVFGFLVKFLMGEILTDMPENLQILLKR